MVGHRTATVRLVRARARLVVARGLIALALASVLGCGPAATAVPGTTRPLATGSAPATAGAQPATRGVAAGTVTYADGRPLPGAQVIVIGIEYETEVDAVTDAGGAYSATVAELEATYRMAASIETPFDGETYQFPLEPDGGDTHFRGADGISRDFVWRLEGPGSWASHLDPSDRTSLIGGIIGVFVYDPISDPSGANALVLEPDDIITVTLRPLTSLIDGSDADVVTAQVVIEEATGPYEGEVGDLRDVPLARYEASATLTQAGGAVTNLVVGVRCTRSGCPIRPASMAPTAEVRFLPADPNVHSRPFQGQPAAGIALYVQRP
jgi:hypothetical protein